MRISIGKPILGIFAAAALSYADSVGGEVSAGIFSHSPSGVLSYELPLSSQQIDSGEILGWEDTQNIMIKASLEHPLPLLPNLKLGYSKISFDASASVQSLDWGALNGYDGSIESGFDLTMHDVTLYYELLDNWVSIDTGITARHLDGAVFLETQNPLLSYGKSVGFDTWIALLYLKGRIEVPATDLSFQMEANALALSDTSMYDLELSARYTVMLGLGIEGGYRAVSLDSYTLVPGLDMDLDFSGPYAAIVWDF